MDPLQDDTFAYFRKLSIFLGLWESQPYRERVLRYYIFGSICLYGTLIQVCPLFTADLNFDSIVSIFKFLIHTIYAASLYCCAILHYKTVRKIFTFIIEDWQRSNIDTDFIIIKKYTNECKLYVSICAGFFLLFVTSFVILPFLYHVLFTTDERSHQRNDRFPIPVCVDYFIDPKTYYYPNVIHQTSIVIIVVAVMTSCISLYFWFIQHSCAYLSIIKDKLRQPFRDDDDVIIPIDLSHWIIDIVQHLARIMEFVSMVNTISENYFLLQMLTVFLFLTIDFLSMFEMPGLLKHEENRGEVLSSFMYISGTLLPVYLLCYMGQKLIDTSTDVYREACLVPIYKITPKTQKLLSIMLTMCSKPCTLSIGKVAVISHEIFRDLVRVSLSFAIMVHTMQSI